MKEIEQTIDSKEVAEMVGKDHHKLMRDIKRYIEQLAESKIGFGDFFQESSYKDANNQTRPCYRVTKKGCEFIAHKLTGTKGTAFTARYINRFHEMEEILKGNMEEPTKQYPQKPWYMRKFNGRTVVLFRDFKTLTGIDIRGNYTAFARSNKLKPAKDWNACCCCCSEEEFKEKYGFDFGNDNLLCYLTARGFRKALQIMRDDAENKQRALAVKLLEDISTETKPQPVRKQVKAIPDSTTIQISIKINGNEIDIC